MLLRRPHFNISAFFVVPLFASSLSFIIPCILPSYKIHKMIILNFASEMVIAAKPVNVVQSELGSASNLDAL